MTKRSLYSFLIFCITIVACTSNQNESKHAIYTSSDSSLVTPLSAYHLPIIYPLTDFERLINHTVKDDFLSKGIYINDKKDSIHVSLKKNDVIRIEIKENKMLYHVALHADCFYFIKVMGIPVKNSKPVEADFTIVLSSTPELDKHWKVHPNLSLTSLEWQNRPEINVSIFKIAIDQTVEALLKENEAELMQQLNAIINKEVDLKKPILKIWKDLQKPVALFKENGDTLWLKSGGKEIAASISLSKDQHFIFDIKAVAHTEIGFNKADLPLTSGKLPSLNKSNYKVGDFELTVGSFLDYRSINKILNDKLRGTQIEEAGYELTIDSIQLYTISNSSIGITLNTSGDINGEIYLQGSPIYNSETKELKVSNLSFELNSNNGLLNKAGEALSPYVIEYIAPYLQLDINKYVDQLPVLIMQEVNKGKTGDVAHLVIQQMRVGSPIIQFTQKGIELQVNVKGKANLTIKTLLPTSHSKTPKI